MVSAFRIRVLATFLFLGSDLYHSGRYLRRAWDRPTEALGIPTTWVALAIPTVAFLILFYQLILVVVFFTNKGYFDNGKAPNQ